MYKDDYQYAATRLIGTIVKYGGEPVEVVDFENGTVSIKNLVSDMCTEVDLSSLDLTPVKLGYVDIDGRIVYVARVPKREDWRQGLRNNNINLNLEKEWIVRCILGKYEPFKSQSEKDSFCWHRDWAVYMGELHFKKNKVGTYAKGSEVPLLDEHYKFLEEALKCSMS